MGPQRVTKIQKILYTQTTLLSAELQHQVKKLLKTSIYSLHDIFLSLPAASIILMTPDTA